MSSSDEEVHEEAPDQSYVEVRGIWLRKIGDMIQVLVEGDDGWHLVIQEPIDGSFSRVVDPHGIAVAPLDHPVHET